MFVKRRNPARWRAINARLSREETIWIATVRRDGRPHLTPVWYVWLEDKIYVSIGADSQKFTNLHLNQNVALSLPDTGSVILIEGEAHVADRATVNVLAE